MKTHVTPTAGIYHIIQVTLALINTTPSYNQISERIKTLIKEKYNNRHFGFRKNHRIQTVHLY